MAYSKIKCMSVYGKNQTPKDLDFDIIPTIGIAFTDKKEDGDLGFAIGLYIKWGFWAVGIAYYRVFKSK